jgi:hypothetical protein
MGAGTGPWPIRAGSLSPSNDMRSVITSWMSRLIPGGMAAGSGWSSVDGLVSLWPGRQVVAAAAFAAALTAAALGSVTRWTSSSAISWP